MSSLFGSAAAGVMIILLFIIVIVLAVIVFRQSLRINRLSRKYRLFMKGADGQSIEKALAVRFHNMDRQEAKTESNSRDIQELLEQQSRVLNKYGIVKYDAFEDVGGKMSFALAMLDKDNTGFVLNAIHSRDNCFLYLKEVVKGESYIMLSKEEIEALQKAVSKEEEISSDKQIKDAV